MSRVDSSVLVLPSRRDMQEVATAWEAFMGGQEQGLEKVRPVIRESWLRAQRLGVNPYLRDIPQLLSAEDLEDMQERADLVYVAAPVFETLVKAWEKERVIMGLSDRRGRVLHLAGHAWLLQQAMEVNVVPGTSLAEELVGTALANVVLAQDHSDYVLWCEHYRQAFHPWASLGAPIRHPSTGETIGVVGIGGYELSHPHSLDVIERLATRFEQILHHEELLRRVTLLDEYQRFLLQHPHDVVLAIDGRGHVCGASPAITELLDSPQRVLGRSLLREPELQVEGFRPLVQQDEVRPYELQVAIPRKGITLNAAAIPINGQRQPAGTLLVLPRPGSVRQINARRSPWLATYMFTDLIGNSSVFQSCLSLARRAAEQDFPVLLLGESGTGKELLAQAIHGASSRQPGPFVPLNCGVANDELLVAELFGYVEGAFTGAVKGGRAGKIELAHSGTLFLDEVEAMSPKMQVSLLRVLEEGKVTRVLDLYHRLSPFPILLPPLRERREDIPLLVRHLLKQLGFAHLRLNAAALDLLNCYSWPGNVRELRNILLRAAYLAAGPTITLAELPEEMTAAVPECAAAPAGSLRETELTLIHQALADVQGNLAQAAARLGIHRVTLYRKLKRYGLAG
ncbi:MAG: sigma-54-dependent Fis family transcriptional regulator [Deltaproteobacteria bacterium]|nr:sigma-54-dependent Fis family transcriptional regulator [Deltaproteobacteria bacterium]